MRTSRLWPLAVLALPIMGCTPLQPASPAGRRPAAVADARQLDRRATDLLLRAAESEIDVVRCNAIEALTRVNPQLAMQPARLAAQAESAMVRFAGCAAIGELRDRGGLRPVESCLNDPDARVKLAASFAAVRLGRANDARTLATALTDSPDENMRADAAYLIGRLGDHRALNRLKLAASREKSTKVLVHICTAMAELGDKDGLDALIQFSQGDIVARLVALQSLSELGDPRATDALKLAFNDERAYLQMRLIAARGLGKLGSSAGFKTAAEATHYVSKDENDTMRVRTLAALALGDIGDAHGLAELMTLAQDQSDMRVQVAAAYAICRIAGTPPLATQLP